MRPSLAIGDFSRATHLSVKMLRHYHRIGLLEPADVDPDTGHRRYMTEQIPTAQVIRRFRALEMPLEEFQSIQNTNVNGVFLTAQAAAKAMVAQQRAGTIINTASMSGHIVNTPQQVGHYCASKAAVIHLTKAMAVEFAPYNIRVNSVSPGYILTELVEPLAEYHALWEPKIPLGRLGRPEELIGIYLYLASDASSYMTGSDIVIDGGYTCW